MKSCLKIIVLSLLWVPQTLAQSELSNRSSGRQGAMSLPSRTTSKTTAPKPVTGISRYIYGGGGLVPLDSTRLRWSAGRSSVQHAISFTATLDMDDYDESLKWHFKDVSSTQKSSILKTYNSSGQIIRHLVRIWDNSIGNWKESSRKTYTYSASGHIELTENWMERTMTWENNFRETHTITADSQEYSKSYWSSGTWDNNQRITWYYTGSNLIQTLIWQWNRTTASWEPGLRELNTYSGSDLTATLVQGWISGSWKNRSRSSMTYTAGNVNEKTEDIWNDRTNNWKHDYRTTYTYIGSSIITQLSQKWDTAIRNWTNLQQYHCTYSGGTINKRKSQRWNNSTADWEDDHQYTFTYNADNALVHERFSERWSGVLTPFDEKYYYYDETAVIPAQDDRLYRLNLYPNPATTDQVYLDYATSTNTSTEMILIDITGKTLQCITEPGSIGDHSVSIPVTDLAKGIYIVQLYSDGQPAQAIRFVK